MKRFDLRHLGANFSERMREIIEHNLTKGEVGIFIFEVGDFSSVEKSANLIAQNGWTLMNSLRFNEVDWSIVVKKECDLSAQLRESSTHKNTESSVNKGDLND